MAQMLIFGGGYCGAAIARAALALGLDAAVTTRGTAVPGIAQVPFEQAGPAIARARLLVSTVPPGSSGDPVLVRWGEAIRGGPAQWIGYLSSTGVYGDRGGAWVDEDTPPSPGQGRSRRRLAAEEAWRVAANGRPLDLMRLAGIYGPGRSALDEVRAGRARRILRPGHAFGRIHRDDVARGVLAALAHPPHGTRVLNFADDLPAESAAVIDEAARLLGVAAPPAVPFEVALAGMSEMGRSFWAENRKVASARTRAALGISWRFPDYRAGLAAILAEECGHGAA